MLELFGFFAVLIAICVGIIVFLLLLIACCIKFLRWLINWTFGKKK